IASSNDNALGLSVDTNRFINSNKGNLYKAGDTFVYEVFAPINVNDVNVGFLNIQYSLESTKAIIDNMTHVSITLIVSFYAIVIFVIYSSYKKNKQLIKLVY